MAVFYCNTLVLVSAGTPLPPFRWTTEVGVISPLSIGLGSFVVAGYPEPPLTASMESSASLRLEQERFITDWPRISRTSSSSRAACSTVAVKHPGGFPGSDSAGSGDSLSFNSRFLYYTERPPFGVWSESIRDFGCYRQSKAPGGAGEQSWRPFVPDARIPVAGRRRWWRLRAFQSENRGDFFDAGNGATSVSVQIETALALRG